MSFVIAIILSWVPLQAFISPEHDAGLIAKTAREPKPLELLQSSRLFVIKFRIALI